MTEWVARAPPSHPDLEGMQATEINTRVLVTCITRGETNMLLSTLNLSSFSSKSVQSGFYRSPIRFKNSPLFLQVHQTHE